MRLTLEQAEVRLGGETIFTGLGMMIACGGLTRDHGAVRGWQDDIAAPRRRADHAERGAAAARRPCRHRVSGRAAAALAIRTRQCGLRAARRAARPPRPRADRRACCSTSSGSTATIAAGKRPSALSGGMRRRVAVAPRARRRAPDGPAAAYAAAADLVRRPEICCGICGVRCGRLMSSPEGQAAGADMQKFATGGVDIFMFDMRIV